MSKRLGLLKEFKTVLDFYSTARSNMESLKAQYTTWRTNHSYVISVQGDDAIYNAIHTMLHDKIPDKDRRTLNSITHMPAYKDFHGKPRVDILYGGGTEASFMLDGHKIKIGLKASIPGTKKDSQVAALFEEDDLFNIDKKYQRIDFTCRTIDARDAVISMLENIAKEEHQDQKRTKHYIYGKYGWDSTNVKIFRNLDTVILRDNQLDVLLQDLNQFLDSEADYARLGIPYHRGYLFHGPPGTGKTTIAKALSSHFKISMYYMPLGDLDSDFKILEAFANIDAGSIILLEDVDVFRTATERSDNNNTASLTGLLNATDGVYTPHGLITIMTTNQVEAIDDALLREGRMDMRLEIDYADEDQVERLYEMAYGKAFKCPTFDINIAPSQIVEIIKRNMNDSESAAIDVRALVEGVYVSESSKLTQGDS